MSAPPQGVEEQVRQAREAQRAWAGLAVAGRLRAVRAFRHLLVDECEALCAAVEKDVDKPAGETLAAEILPLADACRFLEREAASLLRPRKVSWRRRPVWLWGQRDAVHRRPRGVVGVIGTWNYPLFLNGVQIVQALVAGNAVVWKPSEVAPQSAQALHDLLGRAGFPPGLVQRMPATREAGPELVEADIDHLVFTGGVSTGRAIARRLGERLVSSTLELSGCDAQFVLADADVGLAARAAWFGATVNRGQTCIAVRRAFVQRPIYEEFCEALRSLGTSEPVALRLPAQAEQAGRLIAEARAQGGRLLAEGGGEGEGCRPAVVVDARPEMALCREAAFAPVMAVLPFESVEQALEMDARCGFALGASVFSRDHREAARLAARLRAGLVAVNDVILPAAHPATPFGGRGQSGWGVTQGAEGLLEMTVPQAVSERGGTFRPHYDLAAGGSVAGQEALLRGLLEATHAPGVGRRWRGWWQVVRSAWRMRGG